MPSGGWRGKLGSIRALQQQGNRGWSHVPQCCREGCRQPAVSGCRACKAHGGGSLVKRLTPRRKAIRAARAIINRARREGRIPPGLAAHALWAAAQHMRYVHHRPMMLAAWGSTDPAAWPRAVAALEAEMLARPGTCRDARSEIA